MQTAEWALRSFSACGAGLLGGQWPAGHTVRSVTPYGEKESMESGYVIMPYRPGPIGLKEVSPLWILQNIYASGKLRPQ